MKKVEKEGRLILKEISFNRIVSTRVKPHSDSAGRIYLPSDLVGKNVYVIPVEGE